MASRKAGDRLRTDYSSTGEEARASVTRNSEEDKPRRPAGRSFSMPTPYEYEAPDQAAYQPGGIFNSGSRIGETKQEVDTSMSDSVKAGAGAPPSTDENRNRMNKYINNNRDAQEYYKNTSSIAQGAIDRAAKNSYIDSRAMDERIGRREQFNRDQSTVIGGNIFGDMFAFNAPDYKSPDRQTEVETPDFEKLYDKYTDFD